MYDVNYFIDKFSAIPEYKWTWGSIRSGGKSCAFGFCGGYHTKEGIALAQLAGPVVRTGELAELQAIWRLTLREVVYFINDGRTKRYNQPGPKDRILAFLRDVKRAQQATEVVEISNPPITGEELIHLIEQEQYAVFV